MDPSQWRIIPGIALTAAAAGFLTWLAITYSGLLIEVLAVIFGAFLLSLAIRPLADALLRWRIPRGVTVVLVYVLVLALIGMVGRLTVPPVTAEIAQLRERGPQLLEAALARLGEVPLLSRFTPSLDTLAQTLGQQLQSVAGTLLTTAASVGRFVVEIILVLILAAFFTADRDIGKDVLASWIAPQHRSRADSIMRNVSSRLSRWIGAQIGIALYFAVAYGGGLLLIGIPFGATIGVIGGVLEIVPFLGGAFALVAGVLTTLVVAPGRLIWVLLLHVLVTQVEANFVQPTLYGRAVNVHPAAILVALLIGVTAGGVFGALFAVPTVVVLTAIMRELQPYSQQSQVVEETPGGPGS